MAAETPRYRTHPTGTAKASLMLFLSATGDVRRGRKKQSMAAMVVFTQILSLPVLVSIGFFLSNGR
ncbi:hypothetical protein HCH15_11010 [Corynebacterium testudinoris]|nr:hypothetical protein [Corynebacterium testudinoris]MBX8996702.1 hypothetical protein [Corynebacterium testudinoris]